MKIVNTIKYDIAKRGVAPVIDAVQDENNERVIKLSLFANGSAFSVDGYVCSLAFEKPDGTSGWYDTMPDGNIAYAINGNVLSIKIAPQVLTVPGDVKAVIRIETQEGSGRTTTFPFVISVSADPAIDAPKSENYYSVQNWDDVNAKFSEIEQLLADGGNAIIDDDIISKKTVWSSQNIVDKLALTFTESGSIVTCEPVEGYPLGVVSKIEPIQEGSGVASPNNVRNISGRREVYLTRNDEEFIRHLGQTVYGGSLDWNTGVLTIDRALYTFDGKENYNEFGCKNSAKKRYTLKWDSYGGRLLDKMKFSNDKALCSKLPTIDAGDTYKMVDGIGVGVSISRIYFYCDQYATDLDGFKAMMKGAQLVYELAKPKIVQLAPHEIAVLTGVNTFHSDTGDTEVTGKMFPQQYHNRTLMQEEKENACQRIGTLYVAENSDNTITVTLPSGTTKTIDLESLEKVMNATISLGGYI